MHRDAVYTCDVCGERFVDDQIGYERHLAAEHERLRDVLPSVLSSLPKHPTAD